jgi:TonB family protein
LARIERSRQRLNTHLEEVSKMSRTAVLSILSSKHSGGSGRTRRGSGSASLGFGGLEERLSGLSGLTRFEERGSTDPSARDGGPAKADADPLFNKFASARRGGAKKIGTLEFERPKLLGSNAKQAGGQQLQTLSTFISRNQTAIRLLYEERLKMNPALEGKITVVLTIEEDGRVSSARIVPEESTLQDAEFRADLLRRVRRWVFPAFKGGAVELKSPFVFKPL